ncbi:hypothetical protein PQX77_020575 [Marasmius sp. AFHP31]|nr:hypothetical protein PQX77_020575 [Marasmius sp. AFHP31]
MSVFTISELVFPPASLLDFFSHFGDIRLEQPIYLHVRPPPPDLPKGMTSSLHFWSFYETGQFPLSFEVTRSFRLPVEVDLRDRYLVSYSSNTDHYKSIHRYQLLRGFDPTTTDFAQFLGYESSDF